MKMTHTIAIPTPSPEIGILNARTAYVGCQGESLIQEYAEFVASDTFGVIFARRSDDNGTSWSAPLPVFTPKETAEGVEREGEGALLFCPRTKRLVRVFNHHRYPSGTHTKEVYRLTTIMYQVSEDEGRTFGAAEQLVLEGCSAEEWAPGVRYGENCMSISFCNPFVDSRGRLVLPLYFLPPLDPQNTDAYPALPMKATCFFGHWKEGGGLLWRTGEMLGIESGLSSRGLCEPAVAELGDGRFLMICRGSNIRMPSVPARKWVSFSEDGGETWSAAKPLSFDDGEPLFSSATGSQLIRHSRNGLLYWIGNILTENGHGNGPRYPLWIAVVDEANGTLRRDSLFKIDDRREADTDRLQLTNFRTYEDRLSGELVLTMARLFEGGAGSLVSPAYEYRLSVGDSAIPPARAV